MNKFSINAKTCTMKTKVSLRIKTSIFYWFFFAVEDLKSNIPLINPRKNDHIDSKFDTQVAAGSLEYWDTEHQILFVTTLFRDRSEMNWFAVTDFQY